MAEIEKMYALASEQFAQYQVDTELAMRALDEIPVSVHCWQCDDVAGFENITDTMTGGIQATGNYPGRARTPEEVRTDLEKSLSYIPGKSKVNLHASYREGVDIDRDQVEPMHFQHWAQWAKQNGIGLDFNPTFFSHPKSADGYTLASADEKIRRFWVEHGIRSRRIADYLGRVTGERCVNNLWIPDGEKEIPIDSLAPRQRLKESLDEIYSEHLDPQYHADAVECKLFGIGSESYVAGSFEFYMGYAMSHPGILLTLDTGHFHPTEAVSSKISSLLLYLDELLLHVSRPVRWDSDHVVAYDDETRNLMRELAKLGAFSRTSISTDYFDASINRVMALAIGVRNTKKAMLEGLLQPLDLLQNVERNGDMSTRLAVVEEMKAMPVQAVWDEYCRRRGVLTGLDWVLDAKEYEKDVLMHRR